VFSDIETPGLLNGLALAQIAAERVPAIPVVLTSGHVVPTSERLSKAVRFVAKPYNLDAVAALLTHLTSA
jgi:DNA-binding NtrC family response regulator